MKLHASLSRGFFLALVLGTELSVASPGMGTLPRVVWRCRRRYRPAETAWATPGSQALATSSGSCTSAPVPACTCVFAELLLEGSGATSPRAASCLAKPPHFCKWILSNSKPLAERDRLGPLNPSVISPRPQTERG